MKKIFSILFVLVLIETSSCKKYLQEENLGGLTDQTYFKDATGFNALVNSCYASFRSGSAYSGNPWLFEYGTDVTTRGEIEPVSGSVGTLVVRATGLNEYNSLAADNSSLNDFFSNAYSGIQRCNTAINRATKIPGLSATDQTVKVAEAKFLRAYWYYLLVENFGNIPIVTDEINTVITHFTPSTEQAVYDFMISDLTAAVTALPATTTDFGRATQGAAKNLLGLLYLTRGYKSFGTSTDFQKSAQLLDEVINSGTYSLLPSFTDVFKSANQQNKEVIWSIQYEPGQAAGNGQNILFGWRIWREKGFFEGEVAKYNRRISDFMPTQWLYTLFNTTKDSRYDGTFLSQYYASKDDILGTSPIKAGDLRFYFPYPDQTFSAADEAALKAANPNVQVIRYDQWKQDFNGIGGALKFPMINKFFDPLAPAPGNNELAYANTRDLFIFRLADTYLLAAEAYFKMNQLDKAADRLNTVRARAAKPGQSLAITTADVTLDFILDERARELAGEYKRWLDLKRTHKLNRAFEHNILTQLANPGGVQDKYYLRPIPQPVRDRDSGGYPQNPGY